MPKRARNDPYTCIWAHRQVHPHSEITGCTHDIVHRQPCVMYARQARTSPVLENCQRMVAKLERAVHYQREGTTRSDRAVPMPVAALLPAMAQTDAMPRGQNQMPATNDSQRPRIELRLHFVTRHVHVDGATPTQACLSKRNGREASASTFERIQHANTS